MATWRVSDPRFQLEVVLGRVDMSSIAHRFNCCRPPASYQLLNRDARIGWVGCFLDRRCSGRKFCWYSVVVTQALALPHVFTLFLVVDFMIIGNLAQYEVRILRISVLLCPIDK